MSIAALPAFAPFVASTAVLGTNMLLLANNTALSRAKAKEVVNPEDVRLNRGAKVVFEAGNEKTERYRRAHRNALENIPLFLITAFILVLTGISANTAYALFGLFVVARLLHSIAYIRQIQPLRTLSFTAGGLLQLGLIGLLVYRVFAG